MLKDTMRALTPLSLFLGLLLPLSAAADVQCTGPASGHLGAARICEALRAKVGDQDLTLRLRDDSPQILAGHLEWQGPRGPSRSPVVEVTAQDRPLDARAAQRLIQGLLALSDLP